MSFLGINKPAGNRVSYANAAVVALISLLATWAVTGFSILANPFGTTYDHIDQALLNEFWFWTAFSSTVIPVVVSFPIAILLQRERIKLQDALDELAAAHAELAHRSRVDALTGLLNRGAFLAEVEDRLETHGAILMIDVDHFKTINDTFGHGAGDDALRAISKALASKARPTDLVGRLGGEEFAVFLTGCMDEATAQERAEDIRQGIHAIRFEPEPGKLHAITASIGVAIALPRSPIEDVILRADKSLYRAKNSGRNRVILDSAA
ncbi:MULTISPECIES: GGDEF domain-containing protein [Hyphomonas]|uniref:GGDEF domain-containing protein n=1 Tax=Hyphomonas TaxID=85 RepID=UPI0035187E50